MSKIHQIVKDMIGKNDNYATKETCEFCEGSGCKKCSGKGWYTKWPSGPIDASPGRK